MTPNNWLQLTSKSVTPFACAKAASLSQAAELMALGVNAMPTSIHTITFGSGKTIPDRTQAKIVMTDPNGTFNVEIQLPGQPEPTTFKHLKTTDGVLTVPVPLTFLSYASEDREFVSDISKRLLTDGVLTWFDVDDLVPGDRWKDKIEIAMRHSDYFVTFLSSRSVSKVGYFQRELKRALEFQDLRPQSSRFIIPILIDDCDPPVQLDDLHWLRTDTPSWYEKLKSAISQNAPSNDA